MIKLVDAFGAEKLLPETIIFKQVPLEFNVPSQQLSGRDGAVKTGKTTIQPRPFSLEGRIYYPSGKERIRQEFDSILSYLMHPPIEVYRHHTHNRFLRAHALGAPQDWIDLGAELALRIPMIALDPYWYGPEVTVSVSGAQTITVDDTAPAMPLVTAPGSFSLHNEATNQTLAVDGTNIIVDNLNFTCQVGMGQRLDLVNQDWLVTGFELRPGENRLTTTAPVTLQYRPRWY